MFGGSQGRRIQYGGVILTEEEKDVSTENNTTLKEAPIKGGIVHVFTWKGLTMFKSPYYPEQSTESDWHFYRNKAILKYLWKHKRP